MKGKLIKNQICFMRYAFQEVATSKESQNCMLSLETGSSLLTPTSENRQNVLL
jgi:hypothetical protein